MRITSPSVLGDTHNSTTVTDNVQQTLFFDQYIVLIGFIRIFVEFLWKCVQDLKKNYFTLSLLIIYSTSLWWTSWKETVYSTFWWIQFDTSSISCLSWLYFSLVRWCLRSLKTPKYVSRSVMCPVIIIPRIHIPWITGEEGSLIHILRPLRGRSF